MRRSAGLLAVMMIFVMTVVGCADGTPPHIPTLSDPQGPLVELSRSALPVVPGADSAWDLLVPYHGIIGDGRTVARIGPNGEVRWAVDLPDPYVLTNAVGHALPAYLVDSATLVVLAGEGGRVPAGVLALDADTGRRVWEVELPTLGPHGTLRLANGSADPDRGVPVIVRCEPDGCDLRALDPTDGRVLWSRRIPGAVLAAGGFQPIAGGRGRWLSSADESWIWAIGPRFLQAIRKADGTLGARTSLAFDDVSLVHTGQDRVVLATAPHDSTCRVTATGFVIQASGGATIAWSVPFRWDDPRVAAGPYGCRYDPTQVLVSSPVTLPDVDGALTINEYDGGTYDRYRPGEYQLADYGLVWNGSRYVDRSFSAGIALDVPAPRSGAPWAVKIDNGTWTVGTTDGATLFDLRERRPLWHQAGALGAVALDIDRLAFLTRDEVIVVGPERTVTRYR